MTLAVAVVVPFHFLGRPPSGSGAWLRMPATHDVAMHFDHMRAFARGLGAGRPYPRWEEETNKGFGAPSTAFHPPAVYYLTSVVHAGVHDWGLTFLLTHVIVMAGSGLALFACARRCLSARAAAVAMTAYLFLPYHLLDLYQRGALAELLTFVWMPLAWLFLEGLFATDQTPTAASALRPRLRSLAGLAAVVGALFWSHPPTAFAFLLVTGFVALALAFLRRDATGLALAALAVALGLGLAGAYFYPAVGEQGLVRNDVFRSRWAYADNYVLGPRPAEAPAAFWSVVNETWLFSALGIAACSLALLARRSGAALTPALRERVALWSLAGGLVSLLMTPLAAPLEPLIPGLAMTSFPWRMLSVATLALALLAGAAAEAAATATAAGRAGESWLFAAVAALVVGGGVAFSAVVVAAPMAGSTSFQPRADRPTANKFWVLPRWAPEEIQQLPSMERAILAQGLGVVVVERWDPERRRLAVELPAADRLVVRTFDFPGWTATLDGRPATIERGAWGEIDLTLPAGRHEVGLEFRDTPARRTGAVVSLLSVAALAAVLLLARARAPAP